MTSDRRRLVAGTTVALALLASGPATAADHLIPGRMHVARPTLLRMVATAGVFPVPAAGGPADPTAAGGSLTVFDTADGEGFAVPLPAQRWKGLGVPPGSRGYRYRGAGTPEEPCRVVLLRDRLVKFVCRDDQDLNPPVDGASGIVLAVGADRYCAEFGGETVRNQANLLKRRDAPPPAACASLVPTTTSTSTSATSTTSTTSTTVPGSCCNGAAFHAFTVGTGVGDCGIFTSGSSMSLMCGGLYFGGGQNSVPLPAEVPDLGVSVTAIDGCAGEVATLGATTVADTGSIKTCSGTGCFFGAPLAVPNSISTPTSTCVLIQLAGDTSGQIDCGTGAQDVTLPLGAIVYLTGDVANDPMNGIAGIQPCPLCSAGTCVGGPNNGMSCVEGTTAIPGGSYPTSQDCPPDPMFDIGTLPISFELSSGTVTWTAVPSGSQPRVFAGFCRDADTTGAFEQPATKCLENGIALATCSGTFEACEQRDQGAFGPNGGAVRTITEIGAPQAGILGGPAPGTLVSVFSIPPTFDPTVDAAGNLPGPGAVSLPVTGTLCADAMACP